jgi:hypothetical protein
MEVAPDVDELVGVLDQSRAHQEQVEGCDDRADGPG